MSTMPLHLMIHPEDLAIVRLEPGRTPDWDWSGGPYWSLSQTATETSVVCLAAGVPEGARREGPFRAVEVAGPLDFAMVGVMHDILDPLVRAHISVVAQGTYDTDWILVPTKDINDATKEWRRDGLVVTPTVITGKAHP